MNLEGDPVRTIYKTKGVCSREIEIEVSEGVIKSIVIRGGCQGMGQGICRLAEGMKPEDVIKKMKGILCGNKNTSCPDQLSKALETLLEK
jgi:uncharacterized protein (TIGR03905 family)